MAFQKEQQLNRNWGHRFWEARPSGAEPSQPSVYKLREHLHQDSVRENCSEQWARVLRSGRKVWAHFARAQGSRCPRRQHSYHHWEEGGDAEQAEWLRHSFVYWLIHSQFPQL